MTVYTEALRRAVTGAETALDLVDPAGGAALKRLRPADWCGPLRAGDAALVHRCTGPTLDVGCGPGRLLAPLAGSHRVTGCDISPEMLAEARRRCPPQVRLVQADARRLPFAAASFDLACSAYGAVPFVADPGRVMQEVARVLRPGGRGVFSVTHPVRWAFPDDPGPAGLTADRSYFDRTPYVERDADGTVLYAEHHRTLGDRVGDLVAAGFVLERLVEPEWPDDADHVWGGWSRLRGRLLPGTLVLAARLA